MKTLTKNSKAIIEFTLEWSAGGVQFRDSLWANPVNMWRDCFERKLAAALIGRKEGESVSVSLAANVSPFVYQKNRLIRVPPSNFTTPDKVETPLQPRAGQFYPQGYLHGVNGVFQASIAPARYVGVEGEKFLFDLNHPLAGHDLTVHAEIIEIDKAKTERGGHCEDWLETTAANGPGMQSRYQDQKGAFFAATSLEREDETDDSDFYQEPRMVQHLDSTARSHIRTAYGTLIDQDSRILDLMGSWDSHLPDDLSIRHLTVLGMNRKELAANPRAHERMVSNLNKNPALPFDEKRFDAIICTASVEYLIDPLAVFKELQRILIPGGVLAIAFSNRWFPSKAVSIWGHLHEFERLGMVLEMFHRTPGFQDLSASSRRGLPRPNDDPHWEIPHSDPVYMAWGRKSIDAT